ncbi:GAF domain-containing protein [Chloroflexota bacterium]
MGRKSTRSQQFTQDSKLQVTLQGIIDSVEDVLLVIDNEHRIRFANSAAHHKFQQTSGSLQGCNCYQVLQGRNEPCSAPLWNCPLEQVLSSGNATSTIHLSNANKTDTYSKITAYPIHDVDGNIRAIVELRRDVTAERELETQILRRHHQLLALNHISNAISGLWDLDAVLRIALDNVLDIIDGPIGGILLLDESTETLSYRVQQGLSAKYAEEMRMAIGEGIAGIVARTGEPILVEDLSQDTRTARPDLVSDEGIKGFLSIPLKAKDKVVGVLNVASHVAKEFRADDLSLLISIGDYLGTTIEQARLYERLARVGERYRTLLQHSLTAQEQERKRIAGELHDETSQALTSLTLSLQAIIGMAEMKGYTDAEFIQKLQKIHSYAVYAGNEVVRLMKELRPTLLDELGLPAAIHRYANDSLQARGIKLTTAFKGTDQRLPSEVEVILFRITQGIIGNILEHSGAKNASIRLECNDDRCVLQIEDDGKGFDVDKITQVERGGRGAGLFTMRERANLLGGVAYVVSEPGKGTKAIANVPLVTNAEGMTRDIKDEENKGTSC